LNRIAAKVWFKNKSHVVTSSSIFFLAKTSCNVRWNRSTLTSLWRW
jgi:hypothetical protein